MTGSSPDFEVPFVALAPSELMFGSVFSFSGEIGMVSSGTGEVDLNVVGGATVADMAEMRVWKDRAVSAMGGDIRVAR